MGHQDGNQDQCSPGRQLRPARGHSSSSFQTKQKQKFICSCGDICVIRGMWCACEMYGWHRTIRMRGRVGSSILIVWESQMANRRKQIYSQLSPVEVLVRDLSLPNKH